MNFLDSMKELADTATKNVTSLSKSTALKIETKMKIRDLKNEIDDLNIVIRKSNEKIGSMFVDEFKNKISMDEEQVKNLIYKIDDSISRIADINIEIEEVEKDLLEKLDDIEREKYED
ncbi:hypothetical protein UT300003_31770 [Clostridium sardiniense]|uniref:hypothetical protein n=1 Tax=Clostridium sardiniense TaxID=29369 RepID=UPI00195C3E83|nr:hypothetical protein [Clostridium sardiniense]MBM7836736.1 putative nucleic acid-binding Zn-ribbon protein [Clostridium sardiniense]